MEDQSGGPCRRADAYRRAVVEIERAASVSGAVVVLVDGRPGMGKSAFLDALARAARQAGCQVLSSHARRPVSGPLATVVDLLTDAPSWVRSAVPALAAVVADAGRASTEVSGPALGVAMAECLAELRRRGTPTLVVDDLVALDDHSATVLSRELRRPDEPILLLASVPQPLGDLPEPTRELLDWLDRDGMVLRLTLEPLADDDLAALIRERRGHAVDADWLAAVRSATGASPFLVEQLLGSSRRGDAALPADPLAMLTSERAERIVSRLVGTASHDRRVAQVVALIGTVRSERLGMVAAALDLTLGDAAGAFDRLLERGLLVGLDADGYAVAPPIVADALLRRLGPAERWRLLQAVIGWLDERSESVEVLLELAALRARIAEPGDERAISQLVRAADVVRVNDLASAIAWYGAALGLMAHDHLERPLVLSRMSRALFLAGRSADALEAGREALADLPPGSERARSDQVVAEAFVVQASEGPTDEGLEFFREQTRMHPEDLRLRAASVHLLARAGQTSEAVRAMEPVLELIDESGDDERVNALVHLARANCLLARYDEMLAAVERTLAHLEAASFPTQVVAYGFLSYILAEHGDPRATALIADGARLVDRSHWHLWDVELEISRILDEYRAGEWSSAIERIGALAPKLEVAGSAGRLAATRAMEVEILAHRGAWAEARRRGRDRLPSRATEELQTWAVSLVDVLAGTPDDAVALLERCEARSSMPRGRELLIARLSHAHQVAGRFTEAADVARELIIGHRASTAPLPILDAWRVFGAVTGDLEVLEEVLDAAVARQSVLLEATVRLERATLDVDPEPELRAAYQVFHRLGADPWRRRAATQLRQRGLKVPRHRQARPASLTDLELQVARLVQQGSRNRDIARSLAMSVKTVEAYLTRIYAKTGCSGRLELARHLDDPH